MDTEKYAEIEKKIKEGQSPNDEGPFYHHSWWESYKGSIKGKLGGARVGATVGALVGIATVAFLLLSGIGSFALMSGPTLAVIGGLTGAGLLYGAHEFSDIGKIVGAQAAVQGQADAREAVRFAALEKKIDSLTNIVKGKDENAPVTSKLDPAVAELETYRTTHYAQMKPDSKNRFVFWKVAAIGLVVGVAAGALMAIGGESSLAHHLLDGLVDKGGALANMNIMAASMTIMGALGASFGINRDIFRRVFDKTDLWTKGMFSHAKIKEHQVAAGKAIEEELKEKDPKPSPQVATLTLPTEQADYANYPKSSTYHRDKYLAAAEKALLSFDHTRATPQ